MNNTYETIIVFDPKEDYETSLNKFTTLCQEFTGEEYEIDVDDIGMKMLAYEIKDHKEGYYAIITWQGTTDNTVELERQLRIDDAVLKFITIKQDEEVETELKPRSEQKNTTPAGKPIVDVLDIIYNLS